MSAGAYYTFYPLQCQVKTSLGVAQGSSQWCPDAPAAAVNYDVNEWNRLFPSYAVPVPSFCKATGPVLPDSPHPNPIIQKLKELAGSPSGATSPNPAPANGPKNPITGPGPKAPTDGCGPAMSMHDSHRDGEQKYSSYVGSGGKDFGAGFGFSDVDQLAQPNVVGLTPLAVYNANGLPNYTQDPYLDLVPEYQDSTVHAFHEGSAPGILCFHPPELQDYMLHGSGVNADSRWPSDISEVTVLLHNCLRADATTGDRTVTRIAWGNPLPGTVKPKSGIYAEWDPATGILHWQPTDATGADDDAGGLSIGGFFDLDEISTPDTPPSDRARIFARDEHGNTRLFIKTPDGVETSPTRDCYFIVKMIGSAVSKGEAVYVSGAVGASGTAEVSLAQADASDTAMGVLVAMEDGAENDFIRAMKLGKLEDFDTTDWDEGDILYLDPDTPGALTATKPTSPDVVVKIGVVIVDHMNQGTIHVDVDSPLDGAGGGSGDVTALDGDFAKLGLVLVAGGADKTAKDILYATVDNPDTDEWRLLADPGASIAIEGSGTGVTIDNNGSGVTVDDGLSVKRPAAASITEASLPALDLNGALSGSAVRKRVFPVRASITTGTTIMTWETASGEKYRFTYHALRKRTDSGNQGAEVEYVWLVDDIGGDIKLATLESRDGAVVGGLAASPPVLATTGGSSPLTLTIAPTAGTEVWNGFIEVEGPLAS